MNTFYGFKLGQTQAFDKKGARLPVTRILAQSISVEQIKTKEKDGYTAIVFKIDLKDHNFKHKKVVFKKEVKIEHPESYKKGDIVSFDQVLKEEDSVQVSGRDKGKGFAGVVKRWGFKGGPKTHGQSDRQRAPGSIGQRTDPGRVQKGKKMAGHMGNVNKTIRGLKVFKIDVAKNELWVKGLVPGSIGELLTIQKT